MCQQHISYMGFIHHAFDILCALFCIISTEVFTSICCFPPAVLVPSLCYRARMKLEHNLECCTLTNISVFGTHYGIEHRNLSFSNFCKGGQNSLDKPGQDLKEERKMRSHCIHWHVHLHIQTCLVYLNTPICLVNFAGVCVCLFLFPLFFV